MYYEGDGVPKDDKTAVKWWTLSAEQGHAPAQVNLAVKHAFGAGVPKDIVYAYMWANLAASNGKENGGGLRDDLAKKMTPQQIAEAQKLSRECVAKNYKGC